MTTLDRNNSLNSETSSQFNEHSKKRVEALAQAFLKMKKPLNATVSQQELYTFFDERTENPHGFNRKLLQKLFDQINLKEYNTVTVEDFIRGYVQFEHNIKTNLNELYKQLLSQQEQQNKIVRDFDFYKNNQLNDEGIAANAKITVTITEVNMQKKLDDIKLILVTIKYNEMEKHTKFILGDTSHNLTKEQFLFTPKSKKDKFIYNLKGINCDNEEFLIGQKDIDLSTVEKNEKYEIEVAIPEIDDINTIIANIKTEITFYWNDIAKYEEQLMLSQKQMMKLSKGYEQCKQYLNELREPYKFNDDNNSIKHEYEEGTFGNFGNIQHDEGVQRTRAPNYNPFDVNKSQDMAAIHNIIQDNKPYYTTGNVSPIVVKAENIMKKLFNNEKFSWYVFIKLITAMLFAVGIVNCFYRNDFPNALGSLVVIVCCLFVIRGFKGNEVKIKNTLKYLLFSIIGLIGYDLIWLIICGGVSLKGRDKYTGGNENGIGRTSFVVTIISEILKCFTAFGLWAQIQRT